MSYRHDLAVARHALSVRDRSYVRTTRYGTIEYAARGEGPALLVCHPLLGGFDTGLAIADRYLGTGHRVVAPSRFGYLGSTLPADATAQDQADACAVLLDALDIPRVAVFGYSAGGPSAMQFALRHPHRTTALALLAPPLPGKTGRPPKFVAQTVFGSDLFFWALRRLRPSAFARLLGMPKHFRPTPAERLLLDDLGADLFPISPRKQGALFDTYVSTPGVQGFPLERLAVPTILINARDDGFSAFNNAVSAAARIPGASLVPFESGGHLLLGREADVRNKFGRFLTAAAAK